MTQCGKTPGIKSEMHFLYPSVCTVVFSKVRFSEHHSSLFLSPLNHLSWPFPSQSNKGDLEKVGLYSTTAHCVFGYDVLECSQGESSRGHTCLTCYFLLKLHKAANDPIASFHCLAVLFLWPIAPQLFLVPMLMLQCITFTVTHWSMTAFYPWSTYMSKKLFLSVLHNTYCLKLLVKYSNSTYSFTIDPQFQKH